MMGAINILLGVSGVLWITLGFLVLLGHAKRSLYSDWVVKWYLISTGVILLVAELSKFVRMEE